jgi:hypothetical protein
MISSVIIPSFRLFLLPSSSHFRVHAGPTFSRMMGNSKSGSGYPITIDESVMNPKAHGTCENPVMKKLRWGCDYNTADRICCYNRHYAEHSGYWETTKFLEEVNTDRPFASYL